MYKINPLDVFFASSFFFFEHNCTPSGKKMVTGVQVITASQVQSIGCRWQAILSCPHNRVLSRSSRGTHFQIFHGGNQCAIRETIQFCRECNEVAYLQRMQTNLFFYSKLTLTTRALCNHSCSFICIFVCSYSAFEEDCGTSNTLF